jgi:hypothetical protein
MGSEFSSLENQGINSGQSLENLGTTTAVFAGKRPLTTQRAYLPITEIPEFACYNRPVKNRNAKRKAAGKQNRKRSIAPHARSRKQLAPNRTQRNESARERALAALSDIRRGNTLSRAARENGVTPRTIRRDAGSALAQDRPGGRIRATKADRLVRYLVIPGPDGPREVSVRGSKTASRFAKYKADVNRFLRGDRDALSAWH